MTARQLDLLKTKRQRGVVAPTPTELAIHILVASTFGRWHSKGWRMYHIPLGEKRDKATAAKLQRMGVRAGLPDFLLIDPAGTHHWLELKASKGRVNEAQAEFLDSMKASGVPCGLAHSYEQAIDQLRAWGALRVTVMA